MAMTAAHTLMGTPLYMAPEAITGEGVVDGRSHLYALGAVGYFLLTGTPVFSAKTVVGVCSHHLHTPPEPPSARSGLPMPASLERAILQCLAKSPQDRPQDARSLQRTLTACARDIPWSEEDATPWWTRFRASQAPTPAHTDDTHVHGTAVIDLANRVNPFR